MDDEIQWIREEPNQSNAASDSAVQFTAVPHIKPETESLKDYKDAESREESIGIIVDPLIQPKSSFSIPEVVESASSESPNEAPVESSNLDRKVPEITLTSDEQNCETPVVPDVPEDKVTKTISSNEAPVNDLSQKEVPVPGILPDESPVSAISSNEAPVEERPKSQEDLQSGITVDPVISTINHITFAEVAEEKPTGDISTNDTPTDGLKNRDGDQREKQEDLQSGITVDPVISTINHITFAEVAEEKPTGDISTNDTPTDGLKNRDGDQRAKQEDLQSGITVDPVNDLQSGITVDPVISTINHITFAEVAEQKPTADISTNDTPTDGLKNRDGDQRAKEDDLQSGITVDPVNDLQSGITVDPVISTINHITFAEVAVEKPTGDISTNDTPTDGLKNRYGDERAKQEETAETDGEIQWIREEPDEKTLDISEIEKELERNTREARALVEELGRKAERTDSLHKRIHEDIEAQRALLTGIGLHKTIEDEVQLPQYSQLPSGGLPFNVESVLIADGMMDINAAIILPNGLILITNATSVNLFNIQGQVVKKIEDTTWKHPRSPVYHKEHILLLVDYDIGGGNFRRFIFKFTLDLEFVARIEGPKWLEDKHVLKDKIAIAHTDFLYLIACGQISSAIYELSPVGQWTELDFKQSESYVDIVAFATIGPITQLLVVEGRRNYVLQLSVRESDIVDRRKMAICQRPGALAKDDAGRLFVANYGTASIQLVDTVRWISQRNVAVAENPIQFFSACWGLVAMPVKGAIRILKYSFR